MNINYFRWFLFGYLLFLTACAPIHHQVKGWPQNMKVTVHTIPEEKIFKQCFNPPKTPIDVLLLQLPLACSWVNLTTNTCDIYVSPTTTKGTLEHEYKHCKGGDHGGILQRYYDNWKKNK
jgi:hypothetical protein